MCTTLSQAINLLIFLSFPPLIAAFGSVPLFSFAGISVSAAIMFYFTVPETKGKTVAEMIERNEKIQPMKET